MPLDLDAILAVVVPKKKQKLDLDAVIARVRKKTPHREPPRTRVPDVPLPARDKPLELQRGYIKPYGARPGFPAVVRLSGGETHEFSLVEGGLVREEPGRSVYGVHTEAGYALWGRQPGEKVDIPGWGRGEVLTVRHMSGEWTPANVRTYYRSFPRFRQWLKNPRLPFPEP